MLFEYPLTLPANTPSTAPVELLAELAPGTVTRVDVQFPRGCVGLAHVQAYRSGHQVWPTNLDADISAENVVVSWPEDYDLADKPYALTLRGWNDDDSFPHPITFRFALLSLEAKQEAGALASLLRRIAAFLGLKD